MRPLIDRTRLENFLSELGRQAEAPTHLFLVGGSTALAKIERGFETDLADVRSMLAEGLVEPAKLRSLFKAIVGELYRFPAVDAAALAEDLDRALAPERGLEP